MTQSTSTSGLSGLQPLPFQDVATHLNLTSTALAATWFERGSRPDDLMCTFADELAYTLLVMLASHVEEEWLALDQTGWVHPHLMRFQSHTEFILMLATPSRRVAVRLLALATELLEQRQWRGAPDFADVFGKDMATSKAGLLADQVTPQATSMTAKVARSLGVRLAKPWKFEVTKLLAHLESPILPVPAPREAH